MALNPYFQQGSRSEQNLVQDLINEQLRMYGVDIHYLPRKYMAENKVIKEVISSKFDDAYPLEAYIDNYEGYAENPVLLSKFGIENTNDITLVISRERWETYIEPLLQNEANVKLTTRPKEGDLVYFPLGDRLFEIKYVEHEKPFYQLQKNYVYTLRCELFRYEDEVIDTGIAEIDDELTGDDSDGTTDEGISTLLGPTQTFTMVGTGVDATAVTGIVDGGVRFITLSNRGGGYTSPPVVGLSSAPSGGITAVGIASMIGGIQYCNTNLNANQKSVQEVYLANAGAGYTIAPAVTFTSTSGAGAAGTATIGDAVVGIITVTAGGNGYVNPPAITFTDEIFQSGVTTVSAAATAYLSNAGVVTSIYITNAGLGYSVAPTVSIAAADTSSTGNYIFNEIITGSVSAATARVRTWDATTNILEVASVTGTFLRGETLTGATSGATHVLRVVDTSLDAGFADNYNIEVQADAILDFTEANPFGTP